MDSDKTDTCEAKSSGPIPGRKEVLFDGYFYDVTDFVKRHPGNVLVKSQTENVCLSTKFS